MKLKKAHSFLFPTEAATNKACLEGQQGVLREATRRASRGNEARLVFYRLMPRFSGIRFVLGSATLNVRQQRE